MDEEYRGCWNCIYHDKGAGFKTCEYVETSIVYLRCPHWSNGEEQSDEIRSIFNGL